jgi:hypothetical protein
MTDQDIISTIVNMPSKSEKNAWMRQFRNLQTLLAGLEPIEQMLIQLQAEKAPIIDKIATLRSAMLHICIHPAEFLAVDADGIAVCKFCNKRLKVQGSRAVDNSELLGEDSEGN